MMDQIDGRGWGDGESSGILVKGCVLNQNKLDCQWRWICDFWISEVKVGDRENENWELSMTMAFKAMDWKRCLILCIPISSRCIKEGLLEFTGNRN